MQYLLTAYQWDTLGQYDKSFKELYGGTTAEVFEGHPEVVQCMKKLQTDLASVEQTVKKRNSARKMPYIGLLPSRILNSISI
jgi:arachidonate 15-lipoxygenase